MKNIIFQAKMHQSQEPTQKPLAPSAPAFINLSRWIKASSTHPQTLNANELSREIFREK